MNKIKNKLKKIIIFELIFVLLSSISMQICIADELVNTTQTNVETTDSLQQPNISVLSQHAILLEQQSGQILYEYNARDKAYPASTTKLITAILTLENCNLDDVVTVDKNALLGIPRSYTVASLQANEQLTVDQLLHVLLIPSANDAANVLAFHIAGSIESFADMMNDKAKLIGCENTHFTNPSGIHDDNHYSTAYDMALIGEYAYKYEKIREIASTTNYALPPLQDGAERAFKTTNTLINPKNQYFYEYATGLKTGYTDKAKSCIVATAEKDNKKLLCVILGGDKTEDKKSQREIDCKTLFEYGFNNYNYSDICVENNIVDKSQLSDLPDLLKDTDIEYSETLHLMVPVDGSFTTEYSINTEITGPVKKGDTIGFVTYTINGKPYNVALIASNDIYPIASNNISNLFRILVLVLVVAIVLILIRKKNNKRESKYFKRSLY